VSAIQVPIAGGPSSANARDPIAVALLDLVTLGIYGFIWYYRVHRELADLGRAHGTHELGDSPLTSLLAAMPGFLLVVPLVVSFWNATRRVSAAQRLTAAGEPRINTVLAFILMLVLFPVGAAYVQAQLNRVWTSQGADTEPVNRRAASGLVAS
jgi:hypothetical protein